jgi:hypothetical protein
MSNEVTSGNKKTVDDRFARNKRKCGYRINAEQPRRGLSSEDAI